MERTLVLIKPDGVQRGLVGVIIGRIERRGLRLIGIKMLQVSRSLAEKHYAVHKGKPFYDGLIDYIIASPVVAMTWQGSKAVEVVRQVLGSTNPTQASPGTIRADFAVDTGRNLTHGSDSAQTGELEVNLWFNLEELLDWEQDNESWIFEN